MSKNRYNQLNFNSQLDETFRFDSKMDCKKSKARSGSSSIQRPLLDFSQTTSDVIRNADYHNNNILELLEDSDEEKRTNKGSNKKRSELWDFFARFEKQSNPDITISQIQAPKKDAQENHQDPLSFSLNQPKPAMPKKVMPRQKFNTKLNTPGQLSNSSQDQARYPKRQRVNALRYWLGQKCIYRQGKIVDIKRVGSREKES